MGDGMTGRGRVLLRRLAREGGQGTVEYVALILLVVAIMGTVIAAGAKGKGDSISNKVTTEIGKAIDKVGGGAKGS
jgi:hypothetical protein